MVEAAVLAPLGWVASPLMKLLFDKAHQLLGTSINDRRKILEATVLPRLSLAIDKAEKSPNKDKLETLLKRLKDAYYKAEEAVDLFEYELLKQKVKADRKTRFGLPFQSVRHRLVQKTMLKGHIDKIIEIAKEANEFRDLLEAPENATTSNSDRETISQPSGRVFGREKDIEAVADLLLLKPLVSEPGPSTTPVIPIIAITGRSGIGKTILAQCVYQYMEEQSEQNYFDLLLWVHAPRKFEAVDVVKKIIQNIKGKHVALHEGNYNYFVPLEALREQMKGMLRSKKFLLVLDDFWCDANDDREQWEKFISCFSGWSLESKILLTTQNDNALKQASLAGVTEIKIYHLQELEEGQFFELFTHHAWPSDCSIQREKFEVIGHKIATKLKGDPGAAKLVGRYLREKPDIRHWDEIAEKDWLGDNMKARVWSYQQLPVNLQRCFVFCSLFPKGSHCPGNLLIKFWMAEGFIKPTHEEERMEDIGENYLNVLVSRYFIERYVQGKKIYYRLHDLLHDLAERVQGDDFLRIDCTNPRNVLENVRQKLSQSEKIRHISLPSNMIIELKEKLCLMNNLCTLVCAKSNCIIPEEVLQEIFKNSKKLRVIYLPWCGDNLPDSIGKLKHVRYLYFDGSLPLKKLPASICKLYLLQTLVLPSCQSLPNEFFELISLRHIDIEGETMSHIFEVGRLTSLQNLRKFTVKKERGYELHQLENLNHLRGRLCITGLENVMSIEDAVKANMSSKRYLEKLAFQWNPADRSAADNFQLLDALQPHPNIRGLTIEWFTGKRFPNWLLGQNSSLMHLTELQLIRCTNITELSLFPPNLNGLLLHHIPQITYLSENDLLMEEERKLVIAFILEVVKEIKGYMKSRYYLLSFQPVRRYLQFVKERLEATPEIGITNSQGENIFSMVKEINPLNYDYSEDQLLDAWEICMHCHFETMVNKNEESRLILPSSLTWLVISACSITSDALSTCIQCLHSLSELCLVDIQTITTLPPEDALGGLKNLRSLLIKECFLLISLGGIRALTSLTELSLEDCINLNCSNELPSSLERLKFDECAYADAIIGQSDLPSLQVLEVLEVVTYVSTAGRIFYAEDQQMNKGVGVLHLGRFPSLQNLTIGGWKGFLEGLDSLTSLYKLGVLSPGIHISSPTDKCSIRIEHVEAYKPLVLKQMLSDETISSIELLTISLFGDSIDDEVFQSLISLKSLYLKNCNITHLPLHLKNLVSLQDLGLDNCPNLHEIERESLPKNLRGLKITNCPTLSQKFNNYGGSYQVMVYEGSTYVTFPAEE